MTKWIQNESERQRALIFVGTRPEAIKLAPVVRAFEQSDILCPIVCATGQHRELLEGALDLFGITPDYSLELMKSNQTLFDVTTNGLTKLKTVIDACQPRLVLVQGDTSTAFCGALAAFYSQIEVGHVEAGLRTWNPKSPFPEETYRQMITKLSRYHFAPTPQAAQNLRADNVDEENIFVTGNTGVDALLWISGETGDQPELSTLFKDKKMILMTAHRRENFGAPLLRILTAIKEFALAHPEFQIVYPIHPNPNVTTPAKEVLGKVANISLLPPLNYTELVFLMRSCHCILTDSGGIQEEGPSFGKPLLVLRETTERQEAVDGGCAMLVGADPAKIRLALEELADENSPLYRSMANTKNPFGDGYAALRISTILEKKLSASWDKIKRQYDLVQVDTHHHATQG